MTFLSTLHDKMEGVEHAVQNGAAWLLGAFQIAEKDIQTAEADDPLVAEAAAMAKTWAVGHGTLVQNAEAVGDSILTLAKQVAPPPAPAPVSQSGAA